MAWASCLRSLRSAATLARRFVASGVRHRWRAASSAATGRRIEKQKLDSGAFNETELWFIDRETCITTGTIKQADGTEKITYSKGVRVADIAAANKIRRRSTAYNGPARPRG